MFSTSEDGGFASNRKSHIHSNRVIKVVSSKIFLCWIRSLNVSPLSCIYRTKSPAKRELRELR